MILKQTHVHIYILGSPLHTCFFHSIKCEICSDPHHCTYTLIIHAIVTAHFSSILSAPWPLTRNSHSSSITHSPDWKQPVSFLMSFLYSTLIIIKFLNILFSNFSGLYFVLYENFLNIPFTCFRFTYSSICDYVRYGPFWGQPCDNVFLKHLWAENACSPILFVYSPCNLHF